MNKQAVNHFEKINNFYGEYYLLLNQNNVEIALQTLRDKIIKEVCCIFYLDDNYHAVLDETNGHTKKKENKEYSFEIFEITLACLKTFSKNSVVNNESGIEKTAGGENNFARYVTSSINRKLKYLKAQRDVEDDNAMMIPREKIELIRKIKKEYEHFSKIIKNQQILMQQIKIKLNISDENFKILLPMALHKKVSLDNQIFSEKGDCKTAADTIASAIPTAEELIEKQEDFIELLNVIQDEWEKSYNKDCVLSDAITVDILFRMFRNVSMEASSRLRIIDKEYYAILKQYSCFNINILAEYFSDPSYKLPTQSQIGQIHGDLTKAAISKKLSRLYEKVRFNYKA
ncbi:hypothetical protein E4O00_12335 [Treponema sp. OMZ 788]|uniref:hypothetical protein n=1 Tax=Treponema sp. OMZ 788 TaxID=2563664 RepID=UPI0020A3DCB6|nr:hypothetical protein [Treponema sp. OMZ 788]UTC64536.1 hypothetical protein E4O00_12335 [Treponema sp. OMZ 788]